MQDCGLVIDPLTAESQCIGGIVMGVNWALYEDRILDRNTGQMVNPNMEWYLLAGHVGHPEIEVMLLEPARARRHRHRRAADDLHGRRDRQRRAQRDRRRDAQPADHAGQGARRAATQERAGGTL